MAPTQTLIQTAPVFQLTVRCTRCSKHHLAGDLLRYSNNVRLCRKCRHSHAAAVEALAGKRQPECAGCQRNWEELSEEQGEGNIRMMVHFADNVLALYCPSCSDSYEQKRRDLYGETPYGHRRGIR